MLDINYLRDVLDYDKSTGEFKWKKKRKGVKTGVVLGCDNGFGYKRITVSNVSYYAHRLAWFYMHGYFPENQIDHINGIRSDNRIENLREATGSQNEQNKYKAMSNSKSKVLGVSWHKKAKKWQVHICTCRKREYIGLFSNIDDAKEAYLAAKKQKHEFFDRSNHEHLRKIDEITN